MRVHGPSGRTAEEGTAAMVKGIRRMTQWHTKAFSGIPVGDGYEVEVNEFDWADDGGVCYDQDRVTIRHWSRVHNMSGATGYRLDWNGLSFAWTGDGRPDQTTIDVCRGVDVFVTPLQLDTGAVAEVRTGVPEAVYDLSTDIAHTSHYDAGYLISQVSPRIGMVTHVAAEHSLINETIAGVRTHWNGLFSMAAPDGVVVNVTRDAIWNRDSALPDSGNNRRASTRNELAAQFGGTIPRTLEIPPAKYNIAELVDDETMSHEIPAELYTPADVERRPVRAFPPKLVGKKVPIAMLLNAKLLSDALQDLTRSSRVAAEAWGELTSAVVDKAVPTEALGGAAASGVDVWTRAVSQAFGAVQAVQHGMRGLVGKRAMAAQQKNMSPATPKSEEDHHAASLLVPMGEKPGAPVAAGPASRVPAAEDSAVSRYGGGPGAGLTLPPYYRPTPSVQNGRTYFPQSEQLGADEMRITFMGSCPFPPRRSQAATCIRLLAGLERFVVRVDRRRAPGRPDSPVRTGHRRVRDRAADGHRSAGRDQDRRARDPVGHDDRPRAHRPLTVTPPAT